MLRYAQSFLAKFKRTTSWSIYPQWFIPVYLWHNSIEKIIRISRKETDFNFWLLAEDGFESTDQLTACMTE
jgi:hypothetical protein